MCFGCVLDVFWMRFGCSLDVRGMHGSEAAPGSRAALPPEAGFAVFFGGTHFAPSRRMKRTRLAAAVGTWLATLGVASGAGAQTAGINMGAPVYDGVVATEAMKASVDTGAAHVRVNFRLDEWKSPTAKERIGGKTFFDAYDEIIDGITSRGAEVYGLLNDELASSGAPGSAELEDSYVANALAVIDRYKDRVRVWETINEPNDYAGGSSARFSAAAFASAHARVYDEVKVHHQGDSCWDVKLVTGPLFSFDGVSAADYLDQTIAEGRAGGRWRAVREATGHDPVDDIGYHLYVAQGPDSPPSEVGRSAGANLDALKAVLGKYGIQGMKFWISEIGFRLPPFDEPGQAARVDTTFAALAAPARGDIASIQWFSIADFGADAKWGLYGDSLAPKDRRMSHDRFVAQARAHAPALAARLEVDVPKQAAPGATVLAKITATNLGRSSWNAASQVRLGAASGCPAAWSLNATTWSLPPGDGYVTSAVDARRFLPPSAAVGQGQSVTLEVPLVMPSLTGKQHFAARMVQEGVAWFGSTAIADIEVVQPGSSPNGGTDGGNGAGDGKAGTDGLGPTNEPPPAGCRCREAPARDASGGAKGVLFGLGLLAISLRTRKTNQGARTDGGFRS